MPQTKTLKSFPISIGSLENSYKTVFVDKDPTEIEVKIGKVRIRDLEVVDFLAGDIEVSSATMNDCTINDDLTVGDNIILSSDSALISFGADGQDMFLQSDNNGFIIQTQADETNTLNNSLTLQTKSSGTTTTGFGGAINMQLENASGLTSDGVKIGAKYTNASGGSENVSLVVSNESSGTLTERMVLDHSGNLSIDGDIAVNGDTVTTDGNMHLDSGGSLTLDAHDGNFVASKAGTEFSVANSAYAGMIIGYTYLHPTTTLKSFEIQNSITVEDDVHKITFKTPPSEKVEIEVTALINCSSTDTRITVGLSSANATDGYSVVAGQFEYDSTGIFFTDDEVDDQVLTFKFVVESSNLASIGSDNTFWIGFGTANQTKTAYLQYGYRSTHGIGNHPFIIKATALPATIYDGT